MEKTDEREPWAPQQHFVHVLNIDDSKHEDELVEDIVPELVLDALRLSNSKLPEDKLLNDAAEDCQRAVSDVY